jgi:hypothetical protein
MTPCKRLCVECARIDGAHKSGTPWPDFLSSLELTEPQTPYFSLFSSRAIHLATSSTSHDAAGLPFILTVGGAAARILEPPR